MASPLPNMIADDDVELQRLAAVEGLSPASPEIAAVPEVFGEDELEDAHGETTVDVPEAEFVAFQQERSHAPTTVVRSPRVTPGHTLQEVRNQVASIFGRCDLDGRSVLPAVDTAMNSVEQRLSCN